MVLYCRQDRERSDWAEIVKAVLTAGAILFGTSTLNNGMLPTMGGFLTYLTELRPVGKLAGRFGSYGWGGGGVRAVENQLRAMGLKPLSSRFSISQMRRS